MLDCGCLIKRQGLAGLFLEREVMHGETPNGSMKFSVAGAAPRNLGPTDGWAPALSGALVCLPFPSTDSGFEVYSLALS